MTCAQGLLRLLWGGGPEVGVLRDWNEACVNRELEWKITGTKHVTTRVALQKDLTQRQGFWSACRG